MVVKTVQWGNSIGVIIPRALARKKGIGVDTIVEVSEIENGLILRPASKKGYSLRELVRGINAQNRHDEVDFGRPVGKERI